MRWAAEVFCLPRRISSEGIERGGRRRALNHSPHQPAIVVTSAGVPMSCQAWRIVTAQ